MNDDDFTVYTDSNDDFTVYTDSDDDFTVFTDSNDGFTVYTDNGVAVSKKIKAMKVQDGSVHLQPVVTNFDLKYLQKQK